MYRLALCLAVLLAAAPLRAADVTSFTLDNGLEVVVLEDHRSPVVVQMLWYRAGAADEPPGKSGIAHYLEHLLFKGTDTIADGEFSDTVARHGGRDNAFTSQDYTAYFQRVASEQLELMMMMEADRMRNLKLDDQDILTERDVIVEERNQRIENDPGALFSEQRSAALYLNHPYGIPIIGWRHEVDQLVLADALDFYQRFYAPNNAVLIIAGDAEPEDVRVLAEKYYGPLEPTPGLGPRLRPSEPPQISERRMEYADARIAQPYVVRTYLAPERDPGDQEAAAALVLLSDLLGGSGQTSVMAQELQFKQQLAVYSSAFYGGTSYDDTTFGLVVVPVPGVSLADAEAAMDKVIADFIAGGVDEDQLDRLKMEWRAALIYGDDNIQSVANRYGRALTSGLTLQDIEDWPGIVQNVTPEDIIAAAALLQDRDRSVTGWIMPETEMEAGQ